MMKFFKQSVSMIRAVLIISGLANALLLWSCYPDGGFTDVGDYDLIVTQYDPEIDFTAYQTYVMPDSVIHIVDEADEDEISHEFDDQILAEVRDNMANIGYASVDTSQNPDLTLLVYVTSTERTGWAYVPGYGGYWGWWGYYPPYWGPGYGGWAVPYEYTTGTLAMEMIDNSTYNAADSTYQAVWGAGIFGMLEDTDTNIKYRLTRDIDQAYNQSPYLGSD
jgi:hypothetical protein